LSMFRGKLLVPSSVISEACYLLNSFLGGSAELSFLNSLINKELLIEQIKEGDLPRIAELLNKYGDHNIGFVDASVIAVAERLDIKKVLTTDRRHFSIVQPKHCERLTVLP
jgi:predicted nucleic acid-binding protein